MLMNLWLLMAMSALEPEARESGSAMCNHASLPPKEEK